ncbi:MAG: diaminopimelate decarboxylase [Candidatus Pelagibacter sp. TMED275]|nr:MAG: diaminopimelate decarboxylase [Candidatus Pelagibacter sp. TMED275]
MKYINKKLTIDGISLNVLAKKYGTPLYCYSYNELKRNIINFKNNFKGINPLICFSVKSNSNKKILNEIRKFNIGADVVSKGELIKALKSGIKSDKIVFSGVGKTFAELKYAIEKKILLINVESESELILIDKIAKLKKKVVNVGIRLNPDTDAKTIKKISTGNIENKFGVNEREFLRLIKFSKLSKNLNVKCLSVHIGSQILDYRPYKKMLSVVSQVIKKSNYKFDFIDLGGGMGIQYEKKSKKLNYKIYNNLIKKFLKTHSSKIIFEPGRSIIGSTGVLISKITYIKKTKNKIFVILDSAMNDFLRPALYGAKHEILATIKNKKKIIKTTEFVGPICETTDTFLKLDNFQTVKEGDNIVILNTGAYGMSLSSNYNVRPMPTEILIKNKKISVILKRQKLSEII